MVDLTASLFFFAVLSLEQEANHANISLHSREHLVPFKPQINLIIYLYFYETYIHLAASVWLGCQCLVELECIEFLQWLDFHEKKKI